MRKTTKIKFIIVAVRKFEKNAKIQLCYDILDKKKREEKPW
jgi:hypothetical protein